MENQDEINFRGNINQRSEMAQEIISHKPGFMEKWALLIFMSIFLLLVTISWFIRYPDIIEVRAKLTAVNAPKEIICLREGRLVKLFIQNKKEVVKGQVIGYIESTADHDEVLALSKQLDSGIYLFNTRQLKEAARLFQQQYNNVGSIQQEYRQFVIAWQLFNDYMINGFYSRKATMLENDVISLDNTRNFMLTQKKLTQQDMEFAKETYEMKESLSKENVLSKEEFRQEKSRLANKEMTIPLLEIALISNETQKREKIRELDQLDHDRMQQQLSFQHALLSLKNSVDEWKKVYVIQAPISGSIFFTVALQENQFLQQGKQIGFISPGDNRYYAETILPQANFGKIDTGLTVQLRFDAYPFQEIGFVEGIISYVSSVPSDSGFLTTIRLDNGLITNTNNPLAFKNGLTATAIILTKNMRFLERLYYSSVKSTSIGSGQ
ncbi:HlyD family efflux transporter periplasmic adaptor subunit [Chitinophaga sp. SYP-B3965]|uniref:HlyD family secretion protein n=1 Tax=Chitinophaga sp. SYP-B3965 TaxID=2663120 RepID=UPI001299EBC2|nr:HlyD family secretion protein [Chitinophaga sp. SYP-B3965]MRG46979.1 HlyD family efflux transporter periplasmic adaptor subunit [Chitinophaga sp. SYP-B3965]